MAARVHSPRAEPRLRGTKLLTVLATALAACGGDVVPTSVRVVVSVDSDSCGAVAPESLPLGCDAELGVWLLESDGEAARSGRCLELATDDDRTLLELPTLLGGAELAFADLDPNEQVGLEVVIYSPSEDRSCPRYHSDAIPAQREPVYFGHSPVVSLSGAEPTIPVTLECLEWPAPEPPLCGQPEPTPYHIASTVTDLETLAPLASDLLTRVGLSFGDLTVPGPSERALFQLLADLIYNGLGATWEATMENPPSFVGCPATRVDETDEAMRVISCQAESAPGGSAVSTTGYYVDLSYLPAVQDIFAGGTPEGMIVGRVVDQSGAPVPLAMVSVEGTDAAIYYLSADRLELRDYTGTAAHGYFVVIGIDGDSCCHTLTAETVEETPRSGSSLAPVALVQDALTATLIVVQ